MAFFVYKQLPVLKHSFDQEGSLINSATAISLNGEKIQLPVLGEKRVYIFWTTWCAPCRAQFELFEKMLSDELLSSAKIIAVNLGEDIQVVEAYQHKNKLPMPVYLIPTGNAWKIFKVKATPSIVFVDEKANISYFTSGISPSAPLRAQSFLNNN